MNLKEYQKLCQTIAGHFTEKDAQQGGTRIGWLGPRFIRWFLDKTEGPLTESTLCCQRLCRVELSTFIIAALGGEEKAEITLSELYNFLKQADKSNWLLCYIRDINGLLRSVNVSWNGYKWDFIARSLEFMYYWRKGGYVLSRILNLKT